MKVEFSIRLADCNIAIKAINTYVRSMCSDYLIDGKADFTVEIFQEDIEFEREKSAREDKIEGRTVRNFSDEYLETLAVYRKIADKMIDYGTLLFHGSVVAVDGIGYLFTAKSGTGKSTHTRLWRELFGKRAVMVNDDKPLLKITNDGVIAYGTPWDGKHRLSSNIAVPLKAICILKRDKTNHIDMISKRDAYVMMIQQCYRPSDSVGIAKMMNLVDRLGESVELYRLSCNMDRDAAKVAYQGMNERKEM